ncbi:MAG: stage II sporulation protein P [Oscillospiraceae bacterium]
MNFKKGVATLVLLAIGLRALAAIGTNPKIRQWFAELSEHESFLTAGIWQSPKKNTETSDPKPGESLPPGLEDENEKMPPFPSEVKIPKREEPPVPSPKVVLPTTIEGGMVIANDTSAEVNLSAMVAEGPSLRLPKKGVQILIVHTHSSEAYMPDALDNYTPTDSFRTEDTNYNIVRVGDELAACLESYGLGVIHDRQINDYPSYTGSYGRSGEAVERHLAEHPEIAIVFDVHRDAIGTGDVVYKTIAETGGQPCSQVMMLAGTGANGLSHPNWQENLKLALYLQSAVVNLHPTLVRPIALKKERYNQQLSTGSLILEVGSSGNTLSEALTAVRMFAEAAGPALKLLVGKE